LVTAAYYILGPFGSACALHAYGQRLIATRARETKRAVVAVARKLAVLLLSL
jgi:hypothetical protein